MAHVQNQNNKYTRKRNADLLRVYKKAIGVPQVFELALIVLLELLCFAADLSSFGKLFGQMMGDQGGKVAAASLSLLFPVATYFVVKLFASRLREQKTRERLGIVLLVLMGAFLLLTLALRFPLEEAAESEEGASAAMNAAALCLPAISSVLGSIAAALVMHNPEVDSKVRAAVLRAKISTVKAEIAALKGNDPQKLREHLELIYRAAYHEVDGLMNRAVAESVNALVPHQGLVVHDYLGRLVAPSQSGTDRYDSRPPEFVPQAVSVLVDQKPKPELEQPQEEVFQSAVSVEANHNSVN